jgi:glutamate-1-semialdehyde 2,1-aminomutase
MNRTNSDRWFERAGKVIPGGIYGHVAPVAGLPRSFPHYCERANGSRFVDVDGNEWIDFMCGFGAILHGYLNPEIEHAVDLQRSKGSIFNQPSLLMVELAERMVQAIDFADWAVFAKNGSDLTTWAIRVAREKTGREFVIKAEGAYHGVDAWCDPGLGGRIHSDREKILEFKWNDFDHLSDLVKKRANQIAALILTPYHHAAFAPSQMPLNGFWSETEALCKKEGITLILDDVRTGGRLHDGGSHRYFDFTPDMAVYSKALGNGYAISACLASSSFREAATEVFLTGSCWNDAFAMAAANKSFEISQTQNVAGQVLRIGAEFSSKLEKITASRGIPLKMTGPASMPYPFISGDESLFKIQKFCQFCAAEGLYFHPHHNWFFGSMHTENDLTDALVRAELALEKLLTDCE